MDSVFVDPWMLTVIALLALALASRWLSKRATTSRTIPVALALCMLAAAGVYVSYFWPRIEPFLSQLPGCFSQSASCSWDGLDIALRVALGLTVPLAIVVILLWHAARRADSGDT